MSVVHAAWDKLLAGELDAAHVLLQRVEASSQRYSTYHVVLASLHLTKGEHKAALSAAEQALSLSPGSPHAMLIAELAKERLSVEQVANGAELEPITQAGPSTRRTLASLMDPLETTPISGASVVVLEQAAEQFDIDKTADELTRERPLVRPVPEPEHIQPVALPEPEGAPALVSETLAEIMIRQGKLNDAKKVYIQLSRLQPDRYPHFKAKIEAIDKLLLGTSIAPETTPPDAGG